MAVHSFGPCDFTDHSKYDVPQDSTKIRTLFDETYFTKRGGGLGHSKHLLAGSQITLTVRCKGGAETDPVRSRAVAETNLRQLYDTIAAAARHLSGDPAVLYVHQFGDMGTQRQWRILGCENVDEDYSEASLGTITATMTLKGNEIL